MLNFLIITLIYIIAEVAALKWFYLLIQQGAPIDILFKFISGTSYQEMLKNLYGSEKIWKNNLGKALGDCEMCLSFWLPPICFICYALLCRLVLHYWITDEVKSWTAIVFVNFIWYVAIHGICALLGWAALIKTKKS